MNSKLNSRVIRHVFEDEAYLKAVTRKEAESQRKRTQAAINRSAANNPESHIAAAKAHAAAVYAQINDIAARTDLSRPALVISMACSILPPFVLTTYRHFT